MNKRFHFRSFISFSLFMIIIWLLVTGTVLYISPPGRVAHWQHWVFLGLDKEQWQSQHTLFSYLFVIIGVLHIFFLNWRNLWSYVKLKSETRFRKKKEFLTAIVLFLVVFFGSYMHIPPFASFYNFGENIGFSWEERQRSAPIPHAETLSLQEISETYLKEDVQAVIEKLLKNGISVQNKNETLAEIATENGISPAEIYLILVPEQKVSSSPGGSGKGYGRMTLEEMAGDLGMDIKEVLAILESNKISAKPEETIKDIAAANDMHPSEIVQLIRGDR